MKTLLRDPAERAQASVFAVPLVVDIDGTLHRGDLLWEGLVRIATRPRCWLRVLRAASEGKRSLKDAVAQLIEFDATHVSVDPVASAFVEHARQNGQPVHLASGAPPAWAARVASDAGFFSIAPADGVNLIGASKCAAVQAQFAEFDYIGNSMADMPLWRQARHAIAVNVSAGCAAALRRERPDAIVLSERPSVLSSAVRALRPHQWSKNLLLVMPAIAAQLPFTQAVIIRYLIATLAFCLTASGIYLINDVVDLPNDRQHRTKRERPLASGALPIPIGLFMIVALFGGAVMLAITIGRLFPWGLLGYAALSMAYVFVLKQRLLVDVIVLALLYASRAVAGAMVESIALSSWFIAFTIFAFFSLALAKRVSELHLVAARGGSGAGGRAYRTEDRAVLMSLGGASAMASALVFCLWATTPAVSQSYSHPEVLLFTLPLLLYWHARLWVFVSRQSMHDDPVAFAIRDRVSLLVALCCIACILVAR